jgi:hypothetical protein
MDILKSLEKLEANGSKHILLKDFKALYQRSKNDDSLSEDEINDLVKKATLKNVEGSPSQMKFYHLTIKTATKFAEERKSVEEK